MPVDLVIWQGPGWYSRRDITRKTGLNGTLTWKIGNDEAIAIEHCHRFCLKPAVFLVAPESGDDVEIFDPTLKAKALWFMANGQMVVALGVKQYTSKDYPFWLYKDLVEVPQGEKLVPLNEEACRWDLDRVTTTVTHFNYIYHDMCLRLRLLQHFQNIFEKMSRQEFDIKGKDLMEDESLSLSSASSWRYEQLAWQWVKAAKNW